MFEVVRGPNGGWVWQFISFPPNPRVLARSTEEFDDDLVAAKAAMAQRRAWGLISPEYVREV